MTTKRLFPLRPASGVPQIDGLPARRAAMAAMDTSGSAAEVGQLALALAGDALLALGADDGEVILQEPSYLLQIMHCILQ